MFIILLVILLLANDGPLIAEEALEHLDRGD